MTDHDPDELAQRILADGRYGFVYLLLFGRARVAVSASSHANTVDDAW